MGIDLIGPLETMQRRFEGVEQELALPETMADTQRLQQLSREHSRLSPLIEKFKRYREFLDERKDLLSLSQSSDPEMQKLAVEDLPKLDQHIAALEKELELAILPKDPNEDRNVILEIRAGAGGDEAGLFAADLLRMYTRYAET